jgi:ATP-dependent Clp protease protease subunit
MSNKSWFAARSASSSVGEITIYQDIGAGGVTADDFHAALTRLRGVSTLLIYINSDGGDVSTGMAILNMLQRFPARKLVRIDGLAASMASVIAMVGDEIVMPSNAMLMIHNPWGSVGGTAEQIKSFGEALTIMKSNIVGAYTKRTKLGVDHIRRLMDAETWMGADEAVRLGFADRVEAPLAMAAMASLPDVSKFRNAPSTPRGLDAIRVHSFDKFNRKIGRIAGGSIVYIEKDGRRVLRQT